MSIGAAVQAPGKTAPVHLKVRRLRRSAIAVRAAPDGPGLMLDLCHVRGVVGEVGEDHPLLVVVLAKDLVVAEEETIPDTKSGKQMKKIISY